MTAHRRSGRMGFALALSLAAFTAGAPLTAQDAAVYVRTAGDTVRYHNVTKMDGTVHGAAGDAPFTLSRDAVFAFAFSGTESVTAWYDTISIEASGALGGQKPDPDALVHALFHLRMEPNGRVVIVKAPELPRTARLIAELPPAFDDFFPRLPSTGTLSIGVTWTDTSTRNDADSTGRRVYMRRISHYKVTGDSIIGGRRATVVSQHTDVHIASTTPMQQQPYVAELVLGGDEDSVALFLIAEGRLFSRERTGDLHGAVTYKGGDEPLVVDQNYRYRRSDVLDPPKP
jgi:hypothetical protein